MKSVTLSRSEQNRLRGDSGELAERMATDAYAGYSRFVDSDYYDGKRDSGAVIEVKSTLTRLSGGQKGRFRLWKAQHERLLRHDRDGTAGYVFVLFDVGRNPPVARMAKRKPARIGRQVGARGGWNRSGHASQGKQHKLPIEAVFDR
jgi:hypothetical protein